jgi:parallel beta-helix repeat protein
VTAQHIAWVPVAAVCLVLVLVPGWCLDLTVGPQSGDVVGSDNQALQVAVDAVARDGGGTVFVKTGTYMMYNSLFLRSGVSVVGLGPAPVLQKVDGFSATLVEDGAYGQTRIVVDDASNLKKGMGIAISDDTHKSAWYVEVRSIAAVDGNAITLDEALDLDYLVSRHAKVETSAPVIAGLQVRRARVENLIADGNRSANAALNGCRGGAIYLWKSESCTIDNCTARNFNGDGVSIQVSPNCTVTRSKIYRNAGEGMHPGSGSHHMEVSGCRMQDNGGAGLYVCWLVQNSRFSGNTIERNSGDGISIGHQDTDNLFTDNTIERNGRHGVFFRPETAFNGGHRNTLQNNTIRDNGQSAPGDGIHVEAVTLDLVISGNTIEDTPRDGRTTQQNGIFLAAGVDGVKTRGNTIRGNAAQSIADQSGGLRNSLQM